MVQKIESALSSVHQAKLAVFYCPWQRRGAPVPLRPVVITMIKLMRILWATL